MPGCSLQSTGTGGWVDEIQSKAIAQPAWLQLAAGAAAGACLSLAIESLEGLKPWLQPCREGDHSLLSNIAPDRFDVVYLFDKCFYTDTNQNRYF